MDSIWCLSDLTGIRFDVCKKDKELILKDVFVPLHVFCVLCVIVLLWGGGGPDRGWPKYPKYGFVWELIYEEFSRGSQKRKYIVLHPGGFGVGSFPPKPIWEICL